MNTIVTHLLLLPLSSTYLLFIQPFIDFSRRYTSKYVHKIRNGLNSYNLHKSCTFMNKKHDLYCIRVFYFWFQVVKMFIVVFTVFALCWLPYHLYFICAFLNKRIARWPWTRHIYLVFYFMAMSNAVVNPMIYFAMNAK